MKTIEASRINEAIARGVQHQKDVAGRIRHDLTDAIVRELEDHFSCGVEGDLATPGILVYFFAKEKEFGSKIINHMPTPRIFTGSILSELLRLDPEVRVIHDDIVSNIAREE